MVIMFTSKEANTLYCDRNKERSIQIRMKTEYSRDSKETNLTGFKLESTGSLDKQIGNNYGRPVKSEILRGFLYLSHGTFQRKSCLQDWFLP